MALAVSISAWLTFSALNQLAGAKGGKGCCDTKDCGEGMVNSFLWWTNLTIAVIFTVYVVYDVYDAYGSTIKGHANNLMKKIPAKAPVSKAIQMVFGN